MRRQGSSRVLVFLVVGILLLVAAGWVARIVGESRLLAAEERFEAATGSLSLADYVLPGLEDTENAAIWLWAGAEALEVSDGSTEVIGEILDEEVGRWSPQAFEAAVALIAANRPAFEQLEKCVGREDSSFDFAYEEGFSAVTPPMLELYRVGRLVAADLRLALAETDLGRVSRDLEILDQLSRALARESFLISALMHLGVERLFLGAIRDVIAADLGDPEILDSLHRKLVGRDSADALRRGISGEAAAVLDSAALRGSSADSTGRGEQLRLWFLEPFQLAALLDGYGEVVDSLESPWIETLERSQSEDRSVSWAAHEFLVTNLLDAVDKLKAIELSRLLAAQALELGIEGLASGRLPDSLDGATPDPYAAGSLLYNLAADGSASLSAPEAIDLWRSEHPGANERQRPVFLWRVPAPGA